MLHPHRSAGSSPPSPGSALPVFSSCCSICLFLLPTHPQAGKCLLSDKPLHRKEAHLYLSAWLGGSHLPAHNTLCICHYIYYIVLYLSSHLISSVVESGASGTDTCLVFPAFSILAKYSKYVIRSINVGSFNK